MEEFDDYDPRQIGDRQFELVEFMSRSRGRGRPRRRRPRAVSFLVVDDKFTFPIKRGELKASSTRTAPKPDNLAEEVLGAGKSADDLLDMVIRRQR